MLKYLAKISMDIFPSVLATIIGAYIVNHYINARPAADTPAVAVAPAHPKKDGKPAGATDVANLPAPGIKAKGISEKAVSEKASADKPAEAKPAPAEAKATEAKPSEPKPSEPKPSEPKASEPKPSEAKAADAKPSEEAAAPVNPRAHQPAPREKAVAKVTPAPSAPVVTPVEASAAPAGNAAPAPDANDLARAAIERLRKTPEWAAQEGARAPDAPHVQEGPRVVTATSAAVRPLPPPITVSSPASEAYGAQQQASSPSYTASVGGDDANRPTPPADIPVPIVTAPPPLDLRADAGGPMPRAKSNVTNVADDMLSAAKSMFHAVLPKSVTPD